MIKIKEFIGNPNGTVGSKAQTNKLYKRGLIKYDFSTGMMEILRIKNNGKTWNN